MSTISKERNDIFNPEYKKKRSFFRKQNVYRMVFAISLICLFLYGSRNFIFGKISYFEIRNMKYKIVESIIIQSNDTTGYFIINKNPYDAKIIIPEINGITHNYDNSVIIPNNFIYISFTSRLLKDVRIDIVGVKN